MNATLKLEGLGLFLCMLFCYNSLYPGNWGVFWALFFVPDVSFAAYLISKKFATIAYNVSHHQGLFAVLLVLGYWIATDWLMQVSLVFLAHSNFDRVMGYGLKYSDSFDHTHLGWIGKSKHLNKADNKVE